MDIKSHRDGTGRGAESKPRRWHPASVALHWLTFLLILFQFWVSGPMLDEKRDLLSRFEFYQLHKSVGLTIAAFVILRLVLRLAVRQPGPDSADPWLRRSAGLVHGALYLCLCALPVTGIGEGGRPDTNEIFGPVPEWDEPRAVPKMHPRRAVELRRVGFDPELLNNPYGTWGSPLPLLIREATS